MNVLSLFDGISCAMVALKRAGLEIKDYYACEIDKHAITVSKKNHPEIVHLGSVVGLSPPTNIDLLIGGSPCQDLSIAKKNRQGLDGERSGLFWEYVRILKESKPKYFILENVNSMSKESKAKITEIMGVEPIMINASLVSAQSRKRLFWTNIPVKELPEDKGILLKDILQPDTEVDERMTSKGKAFCLDANYFKGSSEEHSIEKKVRTMVKVGHIGNTDSQGNRVYSDEGKSVTLSASGGGSGAKTGLYIINGAAIRGNTQTKTESGIVYSDKLDVRQDEKANSLTTTFHNKLALVSTEINDDFIVIENDVAIVKEATKKGFAVAQNGDSIDISFPKSKTRRGRVGNKVKNLMTSQNINVFQNNNIRKLTPIECERLQGLSDNYTEGIPNTQRYKCLGNAFNADVIVHILKYIE